MDSRGYPGLQVPGNIVQPDAAVEGQLDVIITISSAPLDAVQAAGVVRGRGAVSADSAGDSSQGVTGMLIPKETWIGPLGLVCVPELTTANQLNPVPGIMGSNAVTLVPARTGACRRAGDETEGGLAVDSVGNVRRVMERRSYQTPPGYHRHWATGLPRL